MDERIDVAFLEGGAGRRYCCRLLRSNRNSYGIAPAQVCAEKGTGQDGLKGGMPEPYFKLGRRRKTGK